MTLNIAAAEPAKPKFAVNFKGSSVTVTGKPVGGTKITVALFSALQGAKHEERIVTSDQDGKVNVKFQKYNYNAQIAYYVIFTSEHGSTARTDWYGYNSVNGNCGNVGFAASALLCALPLLFLRRRR